jgi:hypothetical protein
MENDAKSHIFSIFIPNYHGGKQISAKISNILIILIVNPKLTLITV